MAPHSHEQARREARANGNINDDNDHRKHFDGAEVEGEFVAFVADGKPHFPSLRVDPGEEESVRRAAAAVVAAAAASSPAAPTRGWKREQRPETVCPRQLAVATVAGGITNRLFRVSGFRGGGGISVGEEEVGDSVLVRVFGAEGMIDRDEETSVFARLARAGLAPPYHGRFANGRVEGWCDGYRPLTTEELSRPRIARGIAAAMAELHQFRPGHPQEPTLWKQLYDWWKQASTATFRTDAETMQCEALKIADLRNELDWLKSDVLPADAAVAFCHNDVLAANVLYDDGTGRIRLIDFEYGGTNYAAFDVANHFNEYAGGPPDHAVPDYSLLPDDGQQREFVRAYLETAAANGGRAAPSDDDAEAFAEQVRGFMMANHLYWALWGVNQAAGEGCGDYDYLLYVENRIKQYRICKERWREKHEGA
jgi:ethanolamine kinase